MQSLVRFLKSQNEAHDAEGVAVTGRSAIIDIGSNSIRLVVYDGPGRVPFILFNEKVMAGLGAELGVTGRISDEAMERGIIALRRFARLAHEMEVSRLRCVATAAVRDAENGAEFVRRAREEASLSVALLSGRQEGEAAGYGVISAIPEADGIVGDLGGGSLELAQVRGGRVEQVVSLPLGVLRLAFCLCSGQQRVEAALGFGQVLIEQPFAQAKGRHDHMRRLQFPHHRHQQRRGIRHGADARTGNGGHLLQAGLAAVRDHAGEIGQTLGRHDMVMDDRQRFMRHLHVEPRQRTP